MAYSDFTLEQVIETFDLKEKRTDLFSQTPCLTPSSWLQQTLDLSLEFALASGSEKARSEFIVAPVLLAMEQMMGKSFAIHSGKKLDVDSTKGLNGECDFILSKGRMSNTIQAPIFSMVEAKKQDLDLGYGQCIAQMLGAKLYNQRKANEVDRIWGCVTTGESWQFLTLQDTTVMFDEIVYYISQLGKILGILNQIIHPYSPNP